MNLDQRLSRCLLTPLLILLFGALTGCQTAGQGGKPVTADAAELSRTPVPETVEVLLLHLNDVYEIGAVSGGDRGGLARIATLRQKLLAENPNTLLVHAGDLLSPSAMGTAKVDGERLAGRQMVAVLNVLGLDLVTFGNHEFDLSREALLQRLEESEFPWISANLTDAEGEPFAGVPPWKVFSFGEAGGAQVRVGFIGVILDDDYGYAKVQDPLASTRRAVQELEGKADVLVGLTHLELSQDAALAAAVPELDLILGGHEHDNYQIRRGDDGTLVLKGDANARSVFVAKLTYHPSTGQVDVEPRFVPVDTTVEEDPTVAAEVARWTDQAFAGFREAGFEPTDLVVRTPISLDGRESSVRNGTTALTELLAKAFLNEVPEADLAFYNSGSIRIDDELPAGPLTEYDVIRVLPFGGAVKAIRIRGSLLKKALDQGEANRGSGGFLQTAGVRAPSPYGPWEIAGESLQQDLWYKAAVSDFLLTGREKGLEFLEPGPENEEELEVLGTYRDVRKAFIDELRRTYGSP